MITWENIGSCSPPIEGNILSRAPIVGKINNREVGKCENINAITE